MTMSAGQRRATLSGHRWPQWAYSPTGKSKQGRRDRERSTATCLCCGSTAAEIIAWTESILTPSPLLEGPRP